VAPDIATRLVASREHGLHLGVVVVVKGHAAQQCTMLTGSQPRLLQD